MKKLMGLLLALMLLASCGAQGNDASESGGGSLPDISSIPQAESLPEDEDTDAPAALGAEDEAELLRLLEETGYVFWATDLIPEDPELRSYIVNLNGYGVPYTLVSIAGWNKAGTSNMEYSASAEEMKQAAMDLYGVAYSPENAYQDDGKYIIPAHGPMHYAELLPDTVSAEGDTIGVDILITHIDYTEDPDTTILRHTFTKNPDGVLFPYRLVSVREVSTTQPVVAEQVTAPENVYNAPVLGQVNVDELNVRSGPNTDDEKITMLVKDNPVYIVGDDGGEWLCMYYGWVKAEYVTILGTLE